MTMNGSVFTLSEMILVLLAFALSIFHFRNRESHMPNRKDITFLAGVALMILFAILPARFLGDDFGMSSDTVRQVALLLVVPPLLLSGSDGRFVNRFLAGRKMKAAGDFILHPIAAWMLGMSAMWFWQIPAMAGLAASSEIVKTCQAVSFLVIGMIFIWPVFSPVEFRRLPPPLRAFYLFLSCTGCTLLGILMTFAPASWFHGSDSVADQQVSGLIMWVPACLIYVTNIMVSLAQWYRSERRGETDELGFEKIKLHGE